MLAAFFETFIITFAIIFLAGYALRSFGFELQEEESEELKLAEQFENAIVMCRVEQEADIFYFYNAQDETFVGQARSMSEMEEISDRIQKHIMVIDGDDTAVNALKQVTSEISISK